MTRAGTVTAMHVPRVSVVVPLYNYEQYLDQALESALSQKGVDVDLTIVDDRSTDASLEIARRWATRDSRVRVIQHDRNCGHIQTFNDALASATAPYVVKLDPDDILTPGSLRRSADVLAAHPDVVFVYGKVVHFGGEPPRVGEPSAPKVTVWSGEQWVRRRARGGYSVIAQPEVMIRSAALAEVGLHSDAVPEASDYHLWLRLAATGRVARLRNVVQGLYRVHQNSMQRTIHAGVLSDLRARTTAWQLFLAEHGDSLADQAATQRRIRRTLSREAILWALDTFDEARAESAPIDELKAFARELDPGVTRTLRWHELERRNAVGRSVPTSAFSPTGFVRRHRWDHRLRWAFPYRT